MKGGTLPADESMGLPDFSVVVYPNGAQVWYEGGELRKVIYNTGDIVHFEFDPETNTDRVLRVEPHKPEVERAEQQFTVWSVTRKDIAGQLNEAIERTGVDVPEYKDDDARLTDKECMAYAEGLNNIICDMDDFVDKEAEYYDEVCGLGSDDSDD